MAEQSPLLLATDPSKINPAGANPSDLENYQKSLNDQIQALETRYQQPNWWKVAAGFAKPQLGGFMASLGSASEALGENVEQQRAVALPIAQMRSQLAQSQILTGQNQKAADLYAEHLRSGKPINETIVGELTRIAPDSASTKAAAAQLATQQKNQELTHSAHQDIISAAQAKVAAGMKLSDTEKTALSNAITYFQQLPSAKTNLSPDVLPKNDGSNATPTGTSTAVKPDLSSINKEVSALNEKINKEGYTPENKKLLQDLNAKRNDILHGAQSAPQPNTQQTAFKAYPQTYPYPELEGELPKVQDKLLEKHHADTDSSESRYKGMLDNYFNVASEPNWSTLSTSVDSAKDLILKHQDTAQKVFNLIRGSGEFKDQIKAALDAGAGLSVGNFSGSIRLPVTEFLRAGIDKDEQAYADTLARSLLTIGLARLQAQGVKPEKGSEAYATALTAKANMGETPESAFKAIANEGVTFDTIKKIHDQMNQERLQHRYDPKSATPNTDIYLNSQRIKEIEAEALDRRKILNKQFEEYLVAQKAKKNKGR